MAVMVVVVTAAVNEREVGVMVVVVTAAVNEREVGVMDSVYGGSGDEYQSSCQ